MTEMKKILLFFLHHIERLPALEGHEVHVVMLLNDITKKPKPLKSLSAA